MDQVSCDYCGTIFEKPVSEILRNRSLGRKNFCSRKCVGKNNINNFGDKASDYDISQHAGNNRDEFTGFREFIRRIKNRTKEVDVDIAYLKIVWEFQGGVCPYSGIQLVLPSYKNNDYITTASLDRIDSSSGYVRGNVQFTSTAINYMKGQLSHEQTIKLCQLISQKYLPQL